MLRRGRSRQAQRRLRALHHRQQRMPEMHRHLRQKQEMFRRLQTLEPRKRLQVQATHRLKQMQETTLRRLLYHRSMQAMHREFLRHQRMLRMRIQTVLGHPVLRMQRRMQQIMHHIQRIQRHQEHRLRRMLLPRRQKQRQPTHQRHHPASVFCNPAAVFWAIFSRMAIIPYRIQRKAHPAVLAREGIVVTVTNATRIAIITDAVTVRAAAATTGMETGLAA